MTPQDVPNIVKARQARRPKGPLTADTPLAPKEARFVREYVVDFNGADAARKAGYAPKSAKVTASQLLTKPNVAQAVEDAKSEWAERARISAERVGRDIVTAANIDPAEFLDAQGNILPLHKIPPHVRRAIVSIEVVKRNLKAGDGVVEEVLKIRLIAKEKMHELLARHTGFVEGDGQDRPNVPAFALPSDTPGVNVH